MGHVGQRVFLLRIRQRPLRPVGKARGFVQPLARDGAHQLFVTDLFAKATDHGGDLGVKKRRWDHPGIDVKDFQILPRGVEHLDHIAVTKQLVKRIKAQPVTQRIDQNRIAVILARHGQLHKTQLGIIGPFPQKLGIDRDVRVVFRGLAELRKLCGRFQCPHARFLFLLLSAALHAVTYTYLRDAKLRRSYAGDIFASPEICREKSSKTRG